MPTIKNDKIYALYIRDKHICDGTLEEIALQTGRKRSQLLWMKNALKCKSSHYANIDIVYVCENDGIVTDTRRIIFKCRYCHGEIPVTKPLSALYCSPECTKKANALHRKR